MKISDGELYRRQSMLVSVNGKIAASKTPVPLPTGCCSNAQGRRTTFIST
jgi:hypothetical protein